MSKSNCQSRTCAQVHGFRLRTVVVTYGSRDLITALRRPQFRSKETATASSYRSLLRGLARRTIVLLAQPTILRTWAVTGAQLVRDRRRGRSRPFRRPIPTEGVRGSVRAGCHRHFRPFSYQNLLECSYEAFI